MHAEWRLHRQFIMWCADKVDNKQVVEDPSVSVFNSHRFFFLDVLTRAGAKYINFLAQSPGAPSFDDPGPILAQAEANIDFAWVCHFLYDAGFFTLDFLQGVRGNNSHLLDLLWREFFASAHSGTANKTQYVPMSIMRVFWGMAMTPELDALYHPPAPPCHRGAPGPSVFDLSVSGPPPARFQGPGPLKEKQKQNVF